MTLNKKNYQKLFSNFKFEISFGFLHKFLNLRLNYCALLSFFIWKIVIFIHKEFCKIFFKFEDNKKKDKMINICNIYLFSDAFRLKLKLL